MAAAPVAAAPAAVAPARRLQRVGSSSVGSSGVGSSGDPGTAQQQQRVYTVSVLKLNTALVDGGLAHLVKPLATLQVERLGGVMGGVPALNATSGA